MRHACYGNISVCGPGRQLSITLIAVPLSLLFASGMLSLINTSGRRVLDLGPTRGNRLFVVTIGDVWGVCCDDCIHSLADHMPCRALSVLET